MAIQTQDLLSRLSPLAKLDLSGLGAPGNRSMQREQLRLERERLEETKRRNLEDEKLRRMSEEGEKFRAEQLAKRERKQAEAQAAAEELKRQQAAYDAFHKQADANDFAGMGLAANQLREVGGYAEETGRDEQGRPRWQVARSAQEFRAQQDAERERLMAAQRQQAPEGSVWLPHEPAPPPALNPLSSLGLVDMGQLAETRAQQAQPIVDNLRLSMPQGPYQQSTEYSGRAAVAMGQGPEETAKAALDLGAPGRTAVAAELAAARDQEKAANKVEAPLSPRDQQFIKNSGSNRASRAKKDDNVDGRVSAIESASVIEQLVNSKNPADHAKAVNYMMDIGKQTGPQSDADALRITGGEELSTIDKAFAWVQRQVKGGYWEKTKQSMIDFAKNATVRNKEVVHDWMSEMYAQADGAEHELEAEGIRDVVNRLPGFIRDEYDKLNPPIVEDEEEPEAMAPTPVNYTGRVQVGEPGDEGPAPQGFAGEEAPAGGGGNLGPLAQDTEFMEVFEGLALDKGLDPSLILPLIGYESGGDPTAKNPGSSARGLIQFLDETAQAYGFKDSEEFAQLSRVEQAPYVIDYLVKKGITADHDQGDIYVAIAGPAALHEADDYVVYRKDAPTEKARLGYTKNAKNWDLDGDGLITRKELHTVGMRQGRGGQRQQSEDAETFDEELFEELE